MNHTPRLVVATGFAALALMGSALVSAPASAEPAATPLTSIAFTDGTPDGTGVDKTYNTGTPVSLVINNETTGTFSFTGCWAMWVASGGSESLYDLSPTTALTTWTAGTSITSVSPFIDLSPDAATTYTITLFGAADGETGTDCWAVIGLNPITTGSFTIDVVSEPESMTLSGSATIGSTVTVTAKTPGSLVGEDFDLWVCPDTTIRPTADAPDGANGSCVGPVNQTRTGDSTPFLLSYDPARDVNNPTAEEFWKASCDQYFVVHDYPGGGHSNWIGPVDCDPSGTASLAATGPDSSAGLASIAALAMLLGGTLLTVRRSARASNR